MSTRTHDHVPPASASCESCGMPIESGHYCSYCTDADGRLQPFEERFERMVDWQARREPAASRAELEAATRAYMRSMPAWRDHPALAAGGTPPADAR
jgi:hypothetical protein